MFHRLVFGVAAVGLLCLLGCVPEQVASERTSRKGPNLTPAAADTIILQSVLIEQSLGDTFLDSELWAGNPSAVSGEARAQFAENGLRTCVIRGHAPSRFLELLTAEHTTVNPQLLTFSNRKKEVIPTNGPVENASFQVVKRLGVEPTKFSLRQASFGWQVKPEVVEGGLVRVECEPHVQHGERQDWLRPSGDGTQFTLQGEHPVHRFQELAFSVNLGPEDFLVIGGLMDLPEGLGNASFRLDVTGQARQRVLVIRAGKRTSDSSPRGGPLAAIASKARPE